MVNFLKKFFDSRTGSRFNLYGKIILPLYVKIFLRKCIFCRTIDYMKYNFSKDSLVVKIGVDINRALIFVFLGLYTGYYFLYVQYLNNTYQQVLIDFLFMTIIFVFAFFVLNLFILRSLNKNVFEKFNSIKSDVEIIQKGNISKRIEIKACKEINELVYFTNNVLDKLENAIEHEKQQALIDPLTSCYNRRSLAINFDYIRNKTIRDKTNFSLVILDLDHFKNVNDKYGHKMGDKVLVKFVKVITETIRNHDFVYRIGGEEFVIIFTDINKVKTTKILNRLKKDITYKLKKYVPEVEENITVSGGFVFSKEYNLEKKEILNKMIDDADKLLYKAKNSGRNKIIS